MTASITATIIKPSKRTSALFHVGATSPQWLIGGGLLGASLLLGACGTEGEDTDGDEDSSMGSDSGGSTSSGGSSSGGDSGDGAGGSTEGTGGSGPTGTPYVFVGSTDGSVRAYEMSETDGALTEAGETNSPGLDFMTFHPGTQMAFVSSSGGLATFKYDATTMTFTAGDTTSTSGGGTHVAVDSTGTRVLVAHYNEGALSFFNFQNEEFGAESVTNPGMNAHQTRVLGNFAYVPCLGSHHVAQHSLDLVQDEDASVLTPLEPATAAATGGPRHMDFHPTADVAYVLAENASEVHVLNRDATGGQLTPRAGDSVSTSSTPGYHWSSDIKVHPSGDFLYAVNRNPFEIVLFTIAADQTLTRGTSTPLSDEVRSFGMDPKGGYLQIGAKDGSLTTYAVNETSGELTAGPTLTGLGAINNTEIHYLP